MLALLRFSPFRCGMWAARSYFPGPFCKMPVLEILDKNSYKLEGKCRPKEQQKVLDQCELQSCEPPLQHRTPEQYPERKKISVPKPAFRSMWESHGELHCKQMLPRFDEMYYKPSDPRRACQRTWGECPLVSRRVRKVCCPKDIVPPEIQKRVKPPCPPRCALGNQQRPGNCERDFSDKQCRRVHWPCCSPGRCPPTCDQIRKLSNCLRMPTPHQCFSDRIHTIFKDRNECYRLPVAMCDVMRK